MQNWKADEEQMTERIWLNLLHFTMRRGLESLWCEKPRKYVRNDNQLRVIQTTFPNFVVSSLTQGGTGVEGLHGPFPVKSIPELSALVQLFYLAGDESETIHTDKSNHLYVLIIYQESVLDGLLNPDIIARIESIILQWARSEVKTKSHLNKKRFKSLRQQLEALYAEIEESGKQALQEEIARTSLATVLLQVNELLLRKNNHLLVQVYFTNKMLSNLIPLIYVALVKENKHFTTKILFDPLNDEGFLDLGHVVLNVKGYDSIRRVITALRGATGGNVVAAHLIFYPSTKNVKSFLKTYLEADLPTELHENVYFFLSFKKDGDVIKYRDMLASKLNDAAPSIIPLTVSDGRSLSLDLIQSLADNLIEIAVLTTS